MLNIGTMQPQSVEERLRNQVVANEARIKNQRQTLVSFFTLDIGNGKLVIDPRYEAQAKAILTEEKTLRQNTIALEKTLSQAAEISRKYDQKSIRELKFFMDRERALVEEIGRNESEIASLKRHLEARGSVKYPEIPGNIRFIENQMPGLKDELTKVQKIKCELQELFRNVPRS